MVAKIVRISLLMLVLSVTTAYAQNSDAQEKEREKYIQKQLEEYRERVSTFVNLLHIDDFKGEIIKQKIDEFYKMRNKIMYSEIAELEKEPMIEQLKITNFADVKELYSEETIASVIRFIEDNKAEIKKLQKNKKKKN